MKFYICKHCGNIICYLKSSGVPVFCCGEKMQELVPGTTEAATEKHIPVLQQDGRHVTVTVGSVAHPMTEAHLIEWIVLETEKGFQKVNLTAADAPRAEFLLSDGDSAVAAYAYCNLHGLWKA